MDAATFLGLRPSHNRFRWTMAVEPRISNFGGNLFGGAGLAAAIVASEEVTGRSVEMRIADGRDWPQLDGTPRVDGRSAMWARVTGTTDMSAATLAILGDWVPFALAQALGRPAHGDGGPVGHPALPRRAAERDRRRVSC